MPREASRPPDLETTGNIAEVSEYLLPLARRLPGMVL